MRALVEELMLGLEPPREADGLASRDDLLHPIARDLPLRDKADAIRLDGEPVLLVLGASISFMRGLWSGFGA